MSNRFQQKKKLPAWLWFFMAIPTSIIGLLLYRGRRVRPETIRYYTEPDSIPLNMAGEYHAPAAAQPQVSQPVVAKPSAAWRVGDKDVDEARMDFESPATANESSDIAAELRYHREPPAPRSSEELRDEYIHAEEPAAPIEPAPQIEAAAHMDVAAHIEPTAPIEPAPQIEPDQSKPDDLKVIEGIGPAIARLLSEQGITTFRQLAATPPSRLVEILTQARLNRLADPATWPEQARLAAEGQWDALNELQRSLKGGRRVA